MAIKEGDSLPTDIKVKEMGEKGPQDVSVGDLFKGKTVVLFSVPGAFTPTCSMKHLPGFVEKASEIKAKGVDEIVCMAVNDAFVMGAWGDSQKAHGKVRMVADGNGELTKALGLELDASANGLGIRSKRYSMLVEDGMVKSLNIEDAPGKADISGADNLLKQL